MHAVARERLTALLAIAFVVALPFRASAVELDRELLETGLTNPVFVTAAPGDTGRLFIVEQPGRIKILSLATNDVTSTFLDITTEVDSSGNEQGLLGLAFHPSYASNGFFYVYYTRDPGPGNDVSRISRFTADGPNFSTASTADESSEVVLLEFEQPQSNHNGGMIAFEPRDDSRAYLYIASGDGGGAGDDDSGHGTIGNGQDLTTLLGKILRIDVDEGGEGAGTGGVNYDIPPSNPDLGGLDEIWAYGLRNPFRMGFDRENGDLYIGDVGQGTWEEINHQLGSSLGGENYGWRLKEGPDCFNPSSNCDPGGLTEPVYAYDHENQGGIAVIGGYPYRGIDIPFIEGHYIYADVSGVCETFLSDGTDTSLHQDWASALSVSDISSFGEDANGELYFTIRGPQGQSTGGIFKIIPSGNETIRVDFNASGLEKGNAANPFSTLDLGVRSVASEGTIEIVGDSAITASAETLTIEDIMTITAINGTVTIGVAAELRSESGFETRPAPTP